MSVSVRKLFTQTFEGHKGRPGEVGGSLPKDSGSSTPQIEKVKLSYWPYEYEVDRAIFKGEPDDPSSHFINGYSELGDIPGIDPSYDSKSEYVWRSMSSYELDAIRKTGKIQSKGALVFHDQSDMTFYSSNPSRFYAEGIFKSRAVSHTQETFPDYPVPSFGDHAYIVAVPKNLVANLNEQGEFYTIEPLPASSIQRVLAGRPAVKDESGFSVFGWKEVTNQIKFNQQLFHSGGTGSGFRGHKGRIGEVGGSRKGKVHLNPNFGKFSEIKVKMVEDYNATLKQLRSEGMLDNIVGKQQIGSFEYKKDPGDLDMILLTEGEITSAQDEWNWTQFSNNPYSSTVNIFFAPEGTGMVEEMLSETKFKYGSNTLRYSLFHSGGEGSGFYGHKGRIGEVGGSTRIGTVSSRISSDVYKDSKGNNIYRIKAGSELPYELLEDMEKNAPDGLVRVIYNSESENWHIASHGFGDTDHGDFVLKALDGLSPEYTEKIQARGIYDFIEYKLALYEFTEIAGDIATENNLNEKRVYRDIENTTKSAERHMFYYMKSKPELEFISMSELFGNSMKVITLGSGKIFFINQVLFSLGGKGSGFHGHKGRIGEVGGSTKESSATAESYEGRKERFREYSELEVYPAKDENDPYDAKSIDFQEEMGNQIYNRMDPAQNRSVRRYTNGEYSRINKNLREGTKKYGDYTDTIENLDSVFEISEGKLEENIIVYRGTMLNNETRADTIKLLQSAKDSSLRVTYEDKGFFSSSLSQYQAKGFSQISEEHFNVYFEVQLDKGQSVLALNDNLSDYGHEQEMLLPRGTIFEIIHYTDDPEDLPSFTYDAKIIMRALP